jgi:hypothetical protein
MSEKIFMSESACNFFNVLRLLEDKEWENKIIKWSTFVFKEDLD